MDIDSGVEVVTDFVGAFELVADFHPQIAACEVDGDGVGARRRLTLADGQEVEEVLVEQLPHGYVYENTGESRRMAVWRGRIEVVPLGGHSRVTWTLDVDAGPEVDPDQLLTSTLGLLDEGLGSVKRQLEGLTEHGV